MKAEQIDMEVGNTWRPLSEKKALRRQRVMNSRSYKILSEMTKWMDRYYIDPILGLVPGGWGDTLSAILLLPFVWFSLFVVKSVPLTLAVVYNTLKDIAMGLIPFFVGDLLDVFNHSYIRNMTLIQGFIDDDKAVVKEVNRKTWFFALAIVLCIAVIVLLIWLTIFLVKSLFS